MVSDGRRGPQFFRLGRLAIQDEEAAGRSAVSRGSSECRRRVETSAEKDQARRHVRDDKHALGRLKSPARVEERVWPELRLDS
jgi:hypothetical protein